jgi:hypothetical protein
MMNMLEQEIIEKFRQLEPDTRQRVLFLLEHLEQERPFSAVELMRLPAAERQRLVQLAIASVANEEFETFEAYSEEGIHE